MGRFFFVLITSLALSLGCKKELKDEPTANVDEDDKPTKKKKPKKSDNGECPGSYSDFKDFDSADEQTCTCEEDHVGGAVWGTGIFTTDSSPCAADDDTEVTCKCDPSPSGAVWGSDIYTQDSSICNAAVHNGVITKADGGSVTAKAAPGCKSYAASTVNGVTSSSWGAFDTSFFFPSKGDGICKTPKVVTAAKYKLNQVVDVLWNGAWYEATVIALAEGDKYRIQYTGYSAKWNEWVTPTRMRATTGTALKSSGPKPTTSASASATGAPTGTAPTTAAFAVGEAVNILWKGSWYPGKIIGVKAAEYRVHYDGYAASWDEWVPPSRLKKK